jgi:PTS system mannose-specific IIA component
MVGIVVATHADMSQALVNAAEMILGSLTHVEAITVNREDDVDKIRKRFAEAVDRVGEAGGGVLILTDLFGGTPSNIGFSFLDSGKVEILTGVNLPMLLRAFGNRSDLSLAEIAADLKNHARNSIMVASEVLSG